MILNIQAKCKLNFHIGGSFNFYPICSFAYMYDFFKARISKADCSSKSKIANMKL